MRIIHGDCNEVMRTLEPNTFDALITDPPYASGGAYRADRLQPTSAKYIDSKGQKDYRHHDFEGDQMDQRTWMIYTVEWMRQARKLVKTGGVFALFIDWRQLAALADVIQMSGWILRGIVPWDKINARPQKGRFRQSSEFILWGSNGPLSTGRDAPFLPGVITCPAVPAQKRLHQVEKPLEVMQSVVKFCERGGKIIDPFAGSGTTLLAAHMEGFEVIGIEVDVYYADLARKRIENLVKQE